MGRGGHWRRKVMCVRDGMRSTKGLMLRVLLMGVNPGLRLLNKIIFKKSTSCDAATFPRHYYYHYLN